MVQQDPNTIDEQMVEDWEELYLTQNRHHLFELMQVCFDPPSVSTLPG